MIDLILSQKKNLKNEFLSGLTVALALVPEAVAFAFVAGVDPKVGLWAAFFVGFLTSMIGGRPGMISGATGAMAVVMTGFVVLLLMSRHTPARARTVVSSPPPAEQGAPTVD